MPAKNSTMTTTLDKLAVAGLGTVLGYAAFEWGGVLRRDQDVCLLLLGALAIAWSLGQRRPWAPLGGRALGWALALLPAYLLLEVVPLPLPLLRALSPVRAEAVAALAPLGVRIRLPLSSFWPVHAAHSRLTRLRIGLGVGGPD